MAHSVLSTFFNADIPTFIQQVSRKMNRKRLDDWARAIHRPDADPAKELLQALIFADAPRILAEVTDSTNPIFHNIFIDFDPDLDEMDSEQFADFIDATNTIDDHDDGDYYYTQSTALTNLANYLRGDLSAANPFLYAITNRIWRNIYAYNYSSLFATTFVLHTYLFHFGGWSSETPGVLYDRRSHLAGKTPVMATDREWDDFAVTPHYGLTQFSVLPRVSNEMMNKRGLHRAQTVSVQFGDHTIVFANFCDDGVALMSQFEGRDVAYFLTWEGDDYEEALYDFFNAHASADKMEKTGDDLGTFHSI